MNERIKELYEQAHERKPVMVVDPQTGKPIQAGWANKPMYGNEFNPEKFAELIVQECMKVAAFKDADTNVAGYMAIYRLQGRSTAAQMIKEHFGVES